ncbi:hypothetical protein CYMTET_50260 [Cymbomonas tetramitiformis]|uniref:Uncharacterized protein n=1 Tax=Cymbomonas tetramitiformis TaxID=36881 RepID=A0AAE0ETN9_9CHLO|nr:hypothetical protein CYMTET_50260 [Cymbomonas tetramitiformis]
MVETKDDQPAEVEAGSSDSGKSDSPSLQFSEHDWVKNMVLLQHYHQQLAQQGAVMTAIMKQLQQLNSKEAKVDAAATTAVRKGDTELARRQKLPHRPYSECNPYPPHPATLETRMPQLYDLYGDKTFDSLNRRSSSSLKYEQVVLAPALAYLYDAVQFSVETLDPLENLDTSRRRRSNREYAELKVKLAFMEEKDYKDIDGLVAEPFFNQWLQEFDSSRQCTVMNSTATQAAKAVVGSKAENGVINAELEAPQTHQNPPRISLAADVARAQPRLAEGLPPAINALSTNLPGAYVTFGDQPEGAYSSGESTAKKGGSARGGRGAALGQRSRGKGHKHESVSRIFLVLKTGLNPRHIVYDFRWIYAFCRKSRCKMETASCISILLEDGDTATPGEADDWGFSFDLKDGYHCVEIDLDFQKLMQLDVQG